MKVPTKIMPNTLDTLNGVHIFFLPTAPDEIKLLIPQNYFSLIYDKTPLIVVVPPNWNFVLDKFQPAELIATTTTKPYFSLWLTQSYS
jgi:hypothetical protein